MIPVAWNNDATPQIITIESTDSNPPKPVITKTHTSDRIRGVVGTTIGAIGLLIVSMGLILILFRRRRAKRKVKEIFDSGSRNEKSGWAKPEMDATRNTFAELQENAVGSELEGSVTVIEIGGDHGASEMTVDKIGGH